MPSSPLSSTLRPFFNDNCLIEETSSPRRDFVEVMKHAQTTNESADFLKDELPLGPLYFEESSSGQPPSTLSPLFKLPPELRSQVLGYLDKQDLASLALVDHDHKQLARCLQFADISFSYSDNSLALMAKLFEECTSTEHSMREKFSIGGCVRRITLASNANYISRRHYADLLLSDRMRIAQEVRTARLDGAVDVYYRGYIDKFCAVLRQNGLPNLEVLDWQDPLRMTPQILSCIENSSASHLRFHRVSVSEEFHGCNLPRWSPWNIKSLSMHIICPPTPSETNSDPTKFEVLVLSQAANSIQSLTWKRDQVGTGKKPSDAIAAAGLQFPNLEQLILHNVQLSEGVLGTICLAGGDNLHSVSVDRAALGACPDSNTYYMNALRTFGCSNTDSQTNIDIKFLQENQHLQSITFSQPLPEIFLDESVLPLLASRFSNLTSLRLEWNSNTISDQSLASLGNLTSLRNLWISAGVKSGATLPSSLCQPDRWFIDHNTIRQSFRKLISLQKLILTRDIYRSQWETIDPYGYYQTKDLPPNVKVEELLTQEELRQLAKASCKKVSMGGMPSLYLQAFMKRERETFAWNKWHSQCMLEHAFAYASNLPELHYMFLGKLPVQLSRGENGERVAVAIVDRIDDELEESIAQHKWGLGY